MLAAVQRPIAVQCIQQPVPKPGWKDRPSWYLVAEQDRMINPHAKVHAHDADHAPLITRPQAVVEIISEAVHDADA